MMRAANDNPKISYETESQENHPDRLGERVFTLYFCLSDPGARNGRDCPSPYHCALSVSITCFSTTPVRARRKSNYMKRYIITAIVAALSFSVVFVVLDAIFRGLRPFLFYLSGAIVFGLFSGIVEYLKENKKKPKNKE